VGDCLAADSTGGSVTLALSPTVHVRARSRRKVAAYAFIPGDPPAEIQLWNVGDNPTDYGVHKWTQRSVREAFGAYRKRGNPLQIDIDHNCSEEERAAAATDEPPLTGGYAHLEIRHGAPWLRFDWSAVGAEQLATRQRLFLSPEYLVDQDTGEITDVIRVSLVGSPGTHNARMLASAKRIRAGAGNMIDPVVLAALEAALEAEDPKAAIESLLAKLKSASGDEPADAPLPVDDVAAEGDAAEGDAPKEEPVAAGADDEKKDPVATAKAAVARAKAAAKQTSSLKIVAELGKDAKASLEALTARVEGVERDRLLEQQGHRLASSIRAWAAEQPLAVVKGLIKSAPEEAAPATRIAATRGAGQGGNRAPMSEDEKVRAELDRRMNVSTAAAPVVRREGTKVFFTPLTQAQARAHVAAKAAARAAEKGA